MRSEHQVLGFTHIIARGCFQDGSLGRLLRRMTGRLERVGTGVCLHFRRKVQDVVPSLRGENGFSFTSIVIQQGFEERFVGIGVRLWTDQRAVESHGQILDDGMRHVVDDVIPCCHHVAAIRVLESEFHLEITSVQIDVILRGRHHKFHGRDARGGGIDHHHAIPIVRNVRVGDLEQIEGRILFHRGTFVSHVGVSHIGEDSNAFASSGPSTFIPLGEMACHGMPGWLGSDDAIHPPRCFLGVQSTCLNLALRFFEAACAKAFRPPFVKSITVSRINPRPV